MKHDFETIDLAFGYVSMGRPMEHTAWLCLKTGETYFVSDVGDSDELPEDFEESDSYIEIPHPQYLRLGRRLVDRFVRRHASHLFDEVDRIFSRKGAYSRYKALLAEKGLLDAWHAFEEAESQAALRQWCEDNNIELAEEDADDAGDSE